MNRFGTAMPLISMDVNRMDIENLPGLKFLSDQFSVLSIVYANFDSSSNDKTFSFYI